VDVAGLNGFSRRFFEFLQERGPDLASLAEVDHSHAWAPGTLTLRVAENLSLSTLNDELTVFFESMHVHLDDFERALELLSEIQNETTLCAEWLCGDELLSSSLTHREPLARPFQLTKPTRVRLRSFHGTFDEVRELEP